MKGRGASDLRKIASGCRSTRRRSVRQRDRPREWRGHQAAHRDPGAEDPLGIYYFKWIGDCFVKQVIDYGLPGEATGCGIYFATADLSGNGLPDIVAPGKDGLYVFFNEGFQAQPEH